MTVGDATSGEIVDELLLPGAIPLSALVAEPDQEPVGTLLALHGGSARARYWDSPVDPAASLLRIGASAGWRTIAVDRPGYGASAHAAERALTTSDQADLIVDAVQPMVDGLPTVVVGHSFGTLVALEIAVAETLPVRGVALCGMPLVYTDAQLRGLTEIDASGIWMKRSRSGGPPSPDHWYGPPGTWDERVLEYRRDLVAANPSAEFDEARRAPELLPGLLEAVDVPIQLAEAEFEWTTAPASDVIAAVRRLVRGPLETFLVERSGHNVSLNSAAASYHRRVVEFADRARSANELHG